MLKASERWPEKDLDRILAEDSAYEGLADALASTDGRLLELAGQVGLATYRRKMSSIRRSKAAAILKASGRLGS